MGIQAKNQQDWLLIHFANMYNRVTTVALYDTLGVEATKFCVDQTEMITISGTIDMLKNLCKIKKEEEEAQPPTNNLSRLKYFIAMGVDTVPQADRTVFEDHGLTVYTIGEVHNKGKETIAKMGEEGYLNPPLKDDVLILSYTSGTTGVPKGVKITHNQLLNVSFAVNSRLEKGGFPVTRSDIYISYLPAAHSFE